MTTLPSLSIPTVTGEVWRPPADLRVTITARWLLATNLRDWSGITGPSSLFGLVGHQHAACRVRPGVRRPWVRLPQMTWDPRPGQPSTAVGTPREWVTRPPTRSSPS